MKKERRDIDRRKQDVGPPQGWQERRRKAERRLPTVVETDVSEQEFFKLLMLSNRRLAAKA